MITAYRYSIASPIAAAPPLEIGLDDLAEAATDAASLLFVVAVDPDPATLERIVSDLGLHELHAEDLLEGQQRSKLEQFGPEYLIALYDCAVVNGRLHRNEIDLAFSHGWVLMVRRTLPDADTGFPVSTVVERFERMHDAYGEGSRGFFVWAVLDVVVDRYFDVCNAIDDALDDAEEHVFADHGTQDTATPRDIYTVQRTLVQFRRVASPVRDVTSSLSRREVPWFSADATEYFRDVYDHVLRVNELVESQRDVLAGLLDAHLSNVNNRMNDVMKKTSSWGAILLVPTLIAGIYGMNFRHLPELEWVAGYPAALGLMVVASGFLYWRFKRSGWL